MTTSNNKGPTRRVMDRLTLIPNSSTDLTAKDAIVFSIHVTNVTGTAATVTIQDKQGTPRQILSAYSVPANSFVNIPFNEGLPMPGGITWVAGTASALVGYIDATRKE